MKLPLLPAVVRLIPNEFYAWRTEGDGEDAKRVRGELLQPDAPVLLFSPVTGLEVGTYLDLARNGAQVNATYAQAALDHLQGAENLAPSDGTPFDAKNPAHVAALDGTWLVECGERLVDRTHLTDDEVGKSSSPSGSV